MRTKSSRRARPVRAAAAVLLLSLSGCGAGMDAQTTEVYTAPNGVDMRQGDVKVLGALVVADDAGGTLVAGLASRQDASDTLTNVEFTDSEGAAITSTFAGDLEIPAGELVQLADTAAVTLDAESLELGRLIDATFTFESSAPASGPVVVVAREGPYADVPTAAADTPKG